MMTIPLFATAQPGRQPINRWQQAATLPPAGKGEHPAGLAGVVSGLLQDRLVVGGGANFPDTLPWMGGHKKYHSNGYIYTKKNGRIVPLKTRFSLPRPVAYAACCTTPEGIVYAGGENADGISRKAWLMTWDGSGSAPRFVPLPDLPVPVTGAGAAAIGRFVYICGGETATASTDQFLVLDLADTAKGWKSLPPLPHQSSYALVVANDSCIYLAGGREKKSGELTRFYDSLFEFLPAAATWKFLAKLPETSAAGTGLACGKDGILLFGGDRGETYRQVEKLILAIAAEKDGPARQELVRHKAELQSAHPGFGRTIWYYDAAVQQFVQLGTLPFPTPVTTQASKWGSLVVIPGGEIRAGIRSPYILSAKLPAWLH